MEESSLKFQELEDRIRQLEEENTRLQAQVKKNEKQPKEPTAIPPPPAAASKFINVSDDLKNNSIQSYEGTLSPSQIERYSRQLLLQGGFGVHGQLALQNAKVLVVGAGGIGSTVILYLAACGVGHLSIVDFDHVDVSNLHRQVIHKTSHVGQNKAESARCAVYQLNPTIVCSTVEEPLTESNALTLVSGHDCIVDASDNPQTRYLINDACVLSGKPLVSGSAMGMEGQLTVYNYQGGLCYRCLYPKPNAIEGSKSCADNGVLGPVPGLIGVLQTVETIKILTGVGDVMSDRLLMYDAWKPSFVQIKKPTRQPNCPSCNGTIGSMTDSFQASQLARGPSCTVQRIPPQVPQQHEVSVREFHRIRQRGDSHLLVDVRVQEQFDLCHLPGAINVPLSTLSQRFKEVVGGSQSGMPIYCICRRGIASAMAVNKILQEEQLNLVSIYHVAGGLDAWRELIDESFPQY